jgi:hypothetical protein
MCRASTLYRHGAHVWAVQLIVPRKERSIPTEQNALGLDRIVDLHEALCGTALYIQGIVASMDAARSFCAAELFYHLLFIDYKGFWAYESISYRKYQGFTILVA